MALRGFRLLSGVLCMLLLASLLGCVTTVSTTESMMSETVADTSTDSDWTLMVVRIDPNRPNPNVWIVHVYGCPTNFNPTQDDPQAQCLGFRWGQAFVPIALRLDGMTRGDEKFERIRQMRRAGRVSVEVNANRATSDCVTLYSHSRPKVEHFICPIRTTEVKTAVAR